jgi:hypothetical protein
MAVKTFGVNKVQVAGDFTISFELNEKTSSQRPCDTRSRYCSGSFSDENFFRGFCPARRDNSNSEFDDFG